MKRSWRVLPFPRGQIREEVLVRDLRRRLREVETRAPQGFHASGSDTSRSRRTSRESTPRVRARVSYCREGCFPCSKYFFSLRGDEDCVLGAAMTGGLREHVKALTRVLRARGASGSSPVLRRIEVDDEGICATVTLERCGRTSGLTLIFEVRPSSNPLWPAVSDAVLNARRCVCDEPFRPERTPTHR